MKVGIVIPTLGRDSLTSALEALQGQDYDELIIIRDRNKNVSNARNRGWNVLNCDVIAFIDDDTIPDKDFVEQGRAFFKRHPDTHLAQGYVYGEIKTSPTFMFVGANLWLQKKWLQKIGGWDERFIGGGQGEDLAIGWETLDKGGNVAFIPGCAVNHPGPNGSAPLEKNTLYLKNKYPQRYQKLISTNISV